MEKADKTTKTETPEHLQGKVPSTIDQALTLVNKLLVDAEDDPNRLALLRQKVNLEEAKKVDHYRQRDIEAREMQAKALRIIARVARKEMKDEGDDEDGEG